ncbi:MAG: hypothetical protein WC533_02300 [Candidatus Pacearchaeota archaeon]
MVYSGEAMIVLIVSTIALIGTYVYVYFYSNAKNIFGAILCITIVFITLILIVFSSYKLLSESW